MNYFREPREVKNRYLYYTKARIMDLQARKYNIIELVMRLNEMDLKQLEKFVESKSELTASLNRSLQQVEEGDYRPHSEVRKKYEKWL